MGVFRPIVGTTMPSKTCFSPHPAEMPGDTRGEQDGSNRHRVISDYIASMSDRYAMKLYNELYGREG